tara:strand:+ start:148 stop:525 length:378 start_codon:yes stop_codon:yes gene_type:complete
MFTIDDFDLNENKYFIGIMMILVNIGSRFIISELSDEHKKLINNKILRRIFIFSVFFMATRDLSISLLLTVMFVFLISELFNENSDYSLIEKEEQISGEQLNTKLDSDKKLQDVIDVIYDVKNNL